MSDIVYDMPIKDAAEALEKSDRQVRRYVKAKRLRARPVRVDGHIKLMFNRDQVTAFKENLAREGAFGETGREIIVDGQLVEGLLEDSEQDIQPAAVDALDAGDGGAVKYVIDALREHIQDLQKENRDLHYQLEQRSGQVGFLQGKIDVLQDEIKMLMPAQPSQDEIVKRKPWYRRMFGGS